MYKVHWITSFDLKIIILEVQKSEESVTLDVQATMGSLFASVDPSKTASLRRVH